MIMPNNTILALLMNEGHREAGEADIDGKHVKWEGGYTVTVLPFEETRGRVRKYIIDPKIASKVESNLAAVHWGAVVELEFTGKIVSDLSIILDWADGLTR